MSSKAEFPAGVELSSFKNPYYFEAESLNYKIDKRVFNDETLSLVNVMSNLYPGQSAIFNILRQELNGRLPLRPSRKEDPSREYIYDFSSPNGWWFDNIFDIVGSFPPTVEQYRLLRHFLFQPDLDVRSHAAQVIDRRLNRYDSAIRSEFEQLIRDDPDYMGRLYGWVKNSREFARQQGTGWWEMFLREIPIKPLARIPEISDQLLRVYFGIGKDNFFEPNAAAHRTFSEEAKQIFTEEIEMLRKLGELQKQGKLTNDEKQKMTSQFGKLDDNFFAMMEGPFPYVGTMLGQLWRLDAKEIVQATSSVIVNPEKFITSIKPTMNEYFARIVALGLMASTFVKDQAVLKVFVNQVLRGSKWRENPEVVSAITRVAYALKIEDIIESILPIARKHKSQWDDPTKYVASSLSYAIARDVSHERVPQPYPQELPYFGY